ncbi:hypothetical protein QE152_g9802 [Popillia japonica]|uniref:Uncharacterized protein n=1 Tax=Popillia japonica TaxID=7064 RepID=A0AAW1LW62_POPJA
MPMDPTKFTDTAQLYVKYILSSIVLVRTFTVHLYLAFYIVMLWPAVFEEKSGLLIPWLVVGAIKCLAMGAMSFSTGLYICLTYRFSRAACWDFLMTQIIDQGPSIYMWFCVLRKRTSNIKELSDTDEYYITSITGKLKILGIALVGIQQLTNSVKSIEEIENQPRLTKRTILATTAQLSNLSIDRSQHVKVSLNY